MSRIRRRKVRILVFSERPIYAAGLRLLLNAEREFDVVGSASRWSEAPLIVRGVRPDVVLLDAWRSILPSPDALRPLVAACASLPAYTIMLMPDGDSSQVTEALRLGIRGVVVNGVNPESLFKCIRTVASGDYWVDGETVADLVRRPHTDPASIRKTVSRNFGLTRRELEIVSLLVGGEPNREIARQCGISEKTVKHHLTNIFDKLGLSSRLELALFAIRNELEALP